MKLTTIFATMGANEWVPPLPSLPTGARNHLAAGLRQPDGSIEVFATLDIENLKLTPERTSSILRTFQVMAAGIGSADIEDVVIFERDKAPSAIKLDK